MTGRGARTIRTVEELRALKGRRPRQGVRRVLLEIPATPDELRRAERRINAGLVACGCEMGAFFVLAALAAVVRHALWTPGALPLTWRSGLAKSGLLLSAGVVGKLAGLAWAEWRLRAAIDRIAPAESAAACTT
jgi:hypothetical protein